VSARILAADDISSVGLDVLRNAGYRVKARPGIAGEALVKELRSMDALLVRSRTRVSQSILEAAPRLRLIGRAGFGMDTIDVEGATSRGVGVVASPEGNATTAAEFVVGLIFSLARNIPRAHEAMRQRKWEKRRFRGMEVSGKTLGVIGCGNVGRAVVVKAKALGMQVLVHDPAISAFDVERLGGRLADWDDLLGQADFLTVHVPGGPRTRDLIDGDAFARMRDGIRLINCSRGGVVNEAALVRAVRSGKVAGAAVDVFEQEPPWASELLDLPQVVITPHLVASTFEAQINVAVNLAEKVRRFFEHGDTNVLVNPDVIGRLRSSE
jgi:D-3-phosphoglycerate dehydrogenase / 2-oxoglutarate reductase